MYTHSRRPGRRLLGAFAGLVLIAAACGSDDWSSSDATQASVVYETSAPV